MNARKTLFWYLWLSDDEDESDALSSSLPAIGKNAAITSETEDDSLTHGKHIVHLFYLFLRNFYLLSWLYYLFVHEDMKVIRIQTSTAPKESRAEVVLSDGECWNLISRTWGRILNAWKVFHYSRFRNLIVKIWYNTLSMHVAYVFRGSVVENGNSFLSVM